MAIREAETMAQDYVQTPSGVYPKEHPKAKEYMTALNKIKENLNNPKPETDEYALDDDQINDIHQYEEGNFLQ